MHTQFLTSLSSIVHNQVGLDVTSYLNYTHSAYRTTVWLSTRAPTSSSPETRARAATASASAPSRRATLSRACRSRAADPRLHRGGRADTVCQREHDHGEPERAADQGAQRAARPRAQLSQRADLRQRHLRIRLGRDLQRQHWIWLKAVRCPH